MPPSLPPTPTTAAAAAPPPPEAAASDADTAAVPALPPPTAPAAADDVTGAVVGGVVATADDVTGAIVGGVVSGLAAVGLLVGAVFILRLRAKNKAATDGGSGGGGVAGTSGVDVPGAPRAMAEEMAGIVFGRYDRNNSGELEAAELASACAELGRPLSDRELATAMQALDVDGSGGVGRAEFMRFWQHGMKVETLLDEACASAVLSASSAARAHVASSSADAATDAAHDERAELEFTLELDDGGGGSKDRPGRKTEASERRVLSKNLKRTRSGTDAFKDAATGKGTKPDARFLKGMRALSSKALPMPQLNQLGEEEHDYNAPEKQPPTVAATRAEALGALEA